jgi:hypothetical protein
MFSVEHLPHVMSTKLKISWQQTCWSRCVILL